MNSLIFKVYLIARSGLNSTWMSISFFIQKDYKHSLILRHCHISIYGYMTMELLKSGFVV